LFGDYCHLAFSVITIAVYDIVLNVSLSFLFHGD